MGIVFNGDVVSQSFNMAYRDKDSILYQKYEKLICFDIYYEDFNFKELSWKMHIKRNTALNNKELRKLGFSATVVLVCLFELCYEELKSS